MGAMKALLARVDEILIPLLQRWSMPALRFSIAVVFIWFGTLKVLGVSPVVELVGATVYWVDPTWFVPFLGVVEVLLGIGLALGRALRMVLLVLVLQMIGTFLVFLILPEVTHQDGNILILTTEGAYIFKNVVILAAAMAIGSNLEVKHARIDARQTESMSS